MKKIIISLSAITTLLFTGCFIDSDTATVRINLGNIPVTKVEKKPLMDRLLMFFAKEAVAQSNPVALGVIAVHIGAIDSNNQLLAKKTINIGNYPADNIVELNVPARNNVTIIVLGENESQRAGYYGYNTAELNAGETVEMIISIEEAVWGYYAKQISTPSYSPHIISWESAGVPVRYVLVDDYSDEVLYKGDGTEVNVEGSSSSYIFYVEFYMFNLTTAEFYYSDV